MWGSVERGTVCVLPVVDMVFEWLKFGEIVEFWQEWWAEG